MKRSSKKGFTLAELLIVIAIIAILVAIMFPVFGAQLNKARAAAELANVRAKYSELLANEMLNIANATADGDWAIELSTDAIGGALQYDGSEITFVSGTPAADGADEGTVGSITVSYKGYEGTFETDDDVTFDDTSFVK